MENYMNEEINERVREIKRSFRMMMNGVVAQSMRDKGVEYHVNWGASLPMLKEKAREIGKDYDLAIALWKDDVRECKILATLVMPADRMLPEVVDIWMEQTVSQEIAELASFNLYQYLPYAADKAYQWIASERTVCLICGFSVLSRLFMNGQEPNERGINEYLDQLLTALQGNSMAVKKAAMASAVRFADLGLVYRRMAESALKSINLELF